MKTKFLIGLLIVGIVLISGCIQQESKKVAETAPALNFFSGRFPVGFPCCALCAIFVVCILCTSFLSVFISNQLQLCRWRGQLDLSCKYPETELLLKFHQQLSSGVWVKNFRVIEAVSRKFWRIRGLEGLSSGI